MRDTQNQPGSATRTSVPVMGLLGRRDVLTSAVAALLAASIGQYFRKTRPKVPVFIADGQSYDRPLSTTIEEAIAALGWTKAALRGKRVLLKPNFVEPHRQSPHISTHPAVVSAAVEYFRKAGATVMIGEAPGHVRDTEMALEVSGIAQIIREHRVPFADLNYASTIWLPNRTGACKLTGFYVPEEVVQADLVVTMPKLKTHHWVGMTASMKNLYGILPGIRYGWPKNVLHHAGIPQTVLDIATLLSHTLAIVDAIDCMEGDGPIMGQVKRLGAVLAGYDLTAVDATAARLMSLRAEKIPYLALARCCGYPVEEYRIEQRGADWRGLCQRFQLPDRPHLKCLLR